MEDREFITIFNEYYPFTRYIIKKPKSIEPTFDDLYLTELFVPNTKIEPIIHNDKFVGFTKINNDEIYVKVKCKNNEELRIGYYDFAEHIRDEIMYITINDMGNYNWQSLYVQDEDEDIPDLEDMLNEQKILIEAKYKKCYIKMDTPSTRFIHI